MPEYVVIGGLGIDHIILADGKRFPPQAGGDGYYSAVGAHIWNQDVGIVSVVPKTYPQKWIDQLVQAGMDTTGIVRKNTSLGLEGTITYQTDGSRVIGAPRGLLKFIQERLPALLIAIGKPIWQKVCPDGDIIPSSYLDAKAAFLAAGAPANQANCLQVLSGKVELILLDPPPLLPGEKHGKIPEGLADLSRVSYLLPSEQEAAEYFGDGIQPSEAAERFFALAAKNVILKIGKRGVMLFLNSQLNPRIVPIFNTNVVDVTGAGDSFGGGFMVGLAETGDPLKAACYGAVSASFVIEGFGADYALNISREQAEERLKVLIRAV